MLLSRLRLFAIPWTIVYQASLSIGFSRQEYWGGLPFPSPGDLPNAWIEPRSPTLQVDSLSAELPKFSSSGLVFLFVVCLYTTLCINYHAIGNVKIQAKPQEGKNWTCMCKHPAILNHFALQVKSLSRVWLFATPWTVAYQAPLSMGFSRQEYWSGLPFPSPGDLPDPGTEPGSPAL